MANMTSAFTKISGLDHFDIGQIFDCGQCFRFDKSDEGGYEGVAFGRYVRFAQPSPDALLIYGADEAETETVWKPFLALNSDYGAIKSDILARFEPYDKRGVIGAAMKCGSGIRILRQNSWEALCSFIISQNNNIPRIKKIIAALSEGFGERAEGSGEKTVYSFPSAAALYEAGEQEIYSYKTGFRAKYIYDAAKRVATGETDLDAIAKLGDDDAMAELLKIKGVGVKVANCTLLYGFGRTASFPVDVWVKRILEKYFPDGLDISKLGDYAGIAQQYLFYYERYLGGLGDDNK